MVKIYNPKIDEKHIDQLAGELASGAAAPMSEDELRAALRQARRVWERSYDTAERAEKRYHSATDELRATQERVIASLEARIWEEHPDWKRESKVTRGRVRRMAQDEASKLYFQVG